MRGGTTVVTVVEQIDERGHHVMLRGRLDVSTVADVRVTMRRIIQDGYLPIMLDLGEAEVGDATGFGFIVEAARCARRHGRASAAAWRGKIRARATSDWQHALLIPDSSIPTAR